MQIKVGYCVWKLQKEHPQKESDGRGGSKHPNNRNAPKHQWWRCGSIDDKQEPATTFSSQPAMKKNWPYVDISIGQITVTISLRALFGSFFLFLFWLFIWFVRWVNSAEHNRITARWISGPMQYGRNNFVLKRGHWNRFSEWQVPKVLFFIIFSFGICLLNGYLEWGKGFSREGVD